MSGTFLHSVTLPLSDEWHRAGRRMGNMVNEAGKAWWIANLSGKWFRGLVGLESLGCLEGLVV